MPACSTSVLQLCRSRISVVGSRPRYASVLLHCTSFNCDLIPAISKYCKCLQHCCLSASKYFHAGRLRCSLKQRGSVWIVLYFCSFSRPVNVQTIPGCCVYVYQQEPATLSRYRGGGECWQLCDPRSPAVALLPPKRMVHERHKRLYR